MEKIGLYFLSVSELQEVDKALTDYGPLLEKMSDDGWYGFLEYVKSHQQEPASKSKSRERFAEVWEQAVESRGAGELTSLFPHLNLPETAYFQDGPDRHLIYLHSEDPLAVKAWVDEHSRKLDFGGRVVLTGQPLLQAEERRATIRDAVASTVLAIVVVQMIHSCR